MASSALLRDNHLLARQGILSARTDFAMCNCCLDEALKKVTVQNLDGALVAIREDIPPVI